MNTYLYGYILRNKIGTEKWAIRLGDMTSKLFFILNIW